MNELKKQLPKLYSVLEISLKIIFYCDNIIQLPMPSDHDDCIVLLKIHEKQQYNSCTVQFTLNNYHLSCMLW